MIDDKKRKLNEALVKVVMDSNEPSSVRFKKVRYFVALGADVNAKLYGKSVLSWAEKNNEQEIVSFLSEKGGEAWEITPLVANNFGNLLIEAARDGRTGIAEQLIKNGANIDKQTESSETTALMAASQEGNLEIVNLLLKRGADLDIKNFEGDTALLCASYGENVEILKVLILCGADVNEKNNKGETALMRAAMTGIIAIAEELIRSGIKIDAKNSDVKTAYDIAVKYNRKELALLIEKERSNQNMKRKIELRKNNAML
jgi:ankyrin repeat protein